MQRSDFSPPPPDDPTGIVPSPVVIPVGLPGRLEELARQSTTSEALLELMHQVALAAVQLIPGVSWAGVTARFDTQMFTCAHTDDRVLILDEGQYRYGDGPCLESIRTGRPVYVDHGQLVRRWPELRTAADHAGVQSVAAFPVHLGGLPVAALNLYGATEAGVSPVEHRVLDLLLLELFRGLDTYSEHHPSHSRTVRLLEVLHDRSLLLIALGMVMARDRIGEAAAQDVLAREAQEAGLSVTAHCERMVQGVGD